MTEIGEQGIDAEAIPEALIEREQWICWRVKERNGKETKVLIVPGTGEFASATDPQTWRSFDEALEYLERGDAAGIGFVFTAEDPFVGIDLDDCRDPETGAPSEEAREIIIELESFTEVSPSGTGYHVIVRGELPGDRSRRGSVEMYETARFFTVTGDHVDATPARVVSRPDALESVYNEYIAEMESSRGEHAVESQREFARGSTGESRSSQNDLLEDDELLERAKNASNGEKFDRLWRGSTAGYDSQSEADMALCCLLAFWTDGDATRVDRLFRQSGLIREKWDEVHYADGSTYGEKTVERAISSTTEFYDPSSEEDDASDTGPVRRNRSTTAQEKARNRTTSSNQVTDGSTGARAAYLAEKNQLLSDRVADLEATLEQKDDRLEELEQENRVLREELTACERQLERLDGSRETGDTDSARERAPIWTRARRFVGSRDE